MLGPALGVDVTGDELGYGVVGVRLGLWLGLWLVGTPVGTAVGDVDGENVSPF